MNKLTKASYLRNFIFGVEDSLVSTVGLLSGVAVAGVPKATILITGVVLIFVEAVSMAAGSFMSEYSSEGYETNIKNPTKGNYVASFIMLASYFVSGFVPLFPYLFLPTEFAVYFSIIVSIFALFILGIVGARISKFGLIKNGIRMVIVGGAAIVIGVIAGKILSGV